MVSFVIHALELSAAIVLLIVIYGLCKIARSAEPARDDRHENDQR